MVLKLFPKSRKFLSGVMVSMMIFSTCPKETFNNKVYAMEESNSDSNKKWAAVGIAAGILAIIGIVGGIIAYFENKAWKKELAARELLIEGTNYYIKDLAKNLKTVIPRKNSDLFRSLVKCQNRYDLLSWQGTIPSSMGLKNLRKVKDCLYSHWLTWESMNAYANVYMLEKMCEDLAKDERFEKSIEIEEKKIEAEKNQQKIINQVNNTHIDNSKTNINNNTFDYSNNYNTSYNTSNQYDTNYNTSYNTNYNTDYYNNYDYNANYNYNNGYYGY